MESLKEEGPLTRLSDPGAGLVLGTRLCNRKLEQENAGKEPTEMGAERLPRRAYPLFSLLCSQKTRGAAFSSNPSTRRQAGTVTRAFLKIMVKKKDLPK